MKIVENNEELLQRALQPIVGDSSAQAVSDAAHALDEGFVDSLPADELNALLDNLEKAQVLLFDRTTP